MRRNLKISFTSMLLFRVVLHPFFIWHSGICFTTNPIPNLASYSTKHLPHTSTCDVLPYRSPSCASIPSVCGASQSRVEYLRNRLGFEVHPLRCVGID